MLLRINGLRKLCKKLGTVDSMNLYENNYKQTLPVFQPQNALDIYNNTQSSICTTYTEVALLTYSRSILILRFVHPISRACFMVFMID